MNKYERLGYMAGSLGAAIRNGLDKDDPDRKEYGQDHAPERLKEIFEYIEEHKLDDAEKIQRILVSNINNVIGQLTGGLIQDLRDQVNDAI